jgi:hypothetical protein
VAQASLRTPQTEIAEDLGGSLSRHGTDSSGQFGKHGSTLYGVRNGMELIERHSGLRPTPIAPVPMPRQIRATPAGRIAKVAVMTTTIPVRQVRALHDTETITVYQAYSPLIADPAIAHGRFADGFKRDRMTWIKPSFLWMMYRSGWAAKPGQERVLAIRIRREGFDWALANSALSSYEHGVHTSRAEWKKSLRAPVRVQWDPERDLNLRPLPHRAVQIGLSGEAVHRFVDDWIVGIDDVTDACHEIHGLVVAGDFAAAQRLRPDERPYLLETL